MTRWLVALPIAIATAIAMEYWARFLHGAVWHGPLWRVHRSHHRPRRGRFEANDLLSALHAPIAVVLVVLGCVERGPAAAVAFGTGLGMTAFGLAYAVLHDGFVHGRLPLRGLARVPWFARLREAHRRHHARGGAPYGFFLAHREPVSPSHRPPPRAARPRR